MSRHRKHCPKEGKRTSRAERDRVKTIERRAEQSGMVGAMDVPTCCFCGNLVASIDAHWNDFGDAYCAKCGSERGLIDTIRIKPNRLLADLEAIDAFTYERMAPKGERSMGGVSVRVPNAKRPVDANRRSRTLTRFERELESELAKAQEREARQAERLALRLAKAQEREARQAERLQALERLQLDRRRRQRARLEAKQFRHRERLRKRREAYLDRRQQSRDAWHRRLFERAMLWLRRDETLKHSWKLEERAWDIAHMKIPDAQAAILEIRQRVYRQEHPTIQAENLQRLRKLTDEQVLVIREEYAAGGWSFSRLAERHGATTATVQLAVTGSTYKHVGGPIHRPRHTPRYSWIPEAMGWTSSGLDAAN